VRTIDVLIIGAGQAGLAMSACLSARGIEHVLIERGRIAERWRSQRWDSLRMLTPNWMTRLPGLAWQGGDPEGFMHRDEVVTLLDGYRRSIAAPVEALTRVLRVSAIPGGYAVVTDRGNWRARAVVLATGACDRPAMPGWAADLPRHIRQIPAAIYRRPDDVPSGEVLVVGAAASGAQIAEELRLSGRAVTLAVGSHARLPRRYRGRDIMEWMDRSGLLTDPASGERNLAASRRQPSLQLVGRPGPDLDLARLAGIGVTLVGRARGVAGKRLALAGDLASEVAASERRRQRVLARVDAHIDRAGIAAPEDDAAWMVPDAPQGDRRSLDLDAAGIGSVVWATGYRRDYAWLDVPVLDAAGELIHDGGITTAPGLYALGLPFQRRRNSTFLDGVGRDAAELAVGIAADLGQVPSVAA
jgi:putative flavoprotein involved in K+ transport